MNTMKVSKAALLTVLTQNRDAHFALYSKAYDNYRKFVVEELHKMLDDAKAGGPVRRHVNFTMPIDHTGDYDKLIGLFELSHDTVVELTLTEYSNYVKDDWSWSKTATAVNSTYAGVSAFSAMSLLAKRNISPMFVAEDAHMPSSY